MLTKSKILSPLNNKQREAVLCTEGPVLILAGAGSGKTRCIVHRIAYLISEKKVNPYNILAVTFTNKAANEMKERLIHLLAGEISTRNLWIGTFHSMCARILRAEYSLTPLTSNFTIFDEDDQLHIMKNVIKKLDLPDTNFPPKRILEIISNQKNNLIPIYPFSVASILRSTTKDELRRVNRDKNYITEENSYYSKVVASIYENYQKYLLDNNGLDFDDLLLYTIDLFQKHSEILKKYQNRFHYVMIDEYQDTNFAQYQFAYLLAKSHKNICVVGDDDQSIYSWRGADIRNILSFEDDYENTKKIYMTQNYRSPEFILSPANELISHNELRHKKELWTAKKEGKRIKLYEVQNGKHEAILISRKIQELVKNKKAKYRDITIFYRTNAQSRLFETQFIKDHINYQIVGGVNFFQRKEIKDILAYLKVLANPNDNESLLRIINFPKRGIGKATINRLLDFAAHKNVSLFNSFQKIDEIKDLSSTFCNKLNSFYALLGKFKKISETQPLNYLIKKIVQELNLIDIYQKEELIKGETRADNIKEFIASTEDFYESYLKEYEIEPKLIEYLQNISLISDIDRTSNKDDLVFLMTMHNAKGLEFPYVFVVGVEDGLIPHRNSMESTFQIEEERRLFYVAMTRTIKELTISYANSRRYFDTYITNFPSRFLNEISDEYFDKFILTSELDKEYPDSFYQFNKKNVDWKTNHNKFRVGQRISHPDFGKGMILSIKGDVDLTKLTISFDSGELKRIISNYVTVL